MNPVQIPGYELLGKLGEGGMAAVWKARQTRLNRVVAVKILRPLLTGTPGELERFKHEAMAAATLSHPNIVQVLDAGECDGHAYTVMEYIPGCTLADWLGARGPLDGKQALDIASDIAAALAYGWNQHRMVHCDIKPDNVLIHEAGTVKLADLGIAQMAGFTDIRVEDGFALGTPHYMSPEQAMHDRKTLDCRADIYSLGATLYHALTGLMPFQGHPMEKVLEQQVTGHLPDLIEINPAIGPAAAYLVEKMMARDPARRQQTWEEVQGDFERVRAGCQVLAPLPSGSLSTVRRHPDRRSPPAAAQPVQTPSRARSLIRLTMQDIRHIQQIRGHREGGLPRARQAATALAAAALVAYTYTALVSQGAWKAGHAKARAQEIAAVGDLFTAEVAPPVPEPVAPPPPGAASQQAFLETLKSIGKTPPSADGENPFLATPKPRTPRVRPPRPDPVAPAPAPEETVAVAAVDMPAEEEPAPPEPAEELPPQEWQDPTYKQAKGLLESAREKYGRALNDRKNATLWHSIEDDLFKAQTLLQGLRTHAPAEANVGDLYRQATKLLFDTHQVMRTLE